eukprot:gnl/Hemi2/14949_TR5061_c0_g1_i1.p2 gnl/Hemi2/14949_TR5061_c0_g1~~gnl/Hemi2/14949_TR5061_c0_g1_i1.p2  ORF type:complete len:228 (-),score=91.47 gnl/Hemi2/14949_TR5061_c0_g1_i1:114-797(-)
MAEEDQGSFNEGSDLGSEKGEEEDTLGAYEGERNLANERHGRGIATFKNGDRYEGQYANGVRHGEGTYVWADKKEKYEGNYVNDKKDGLGSYYYDNGGIYRGMWVKNRRHGEGTFFYKNGDIFTGNWARGRKEGEGTYMFAETKCQFRGQFKAGKFSSGEWIMQDSTVYTGTFSRGIPSGPGTFKFSNGNTQAGKNKFVSSVDDDGRTIRDDSSRQWVGEEISVTQQ